MSDCRRTRGLIGRVVGGAPTDADRAHAATCPSCGPVVARAATFDEDLRRSARSLVREALPPGILEQAVAAPEIGRVVARRAAPSLAALAVAVAVLLTATVVALAPGAAPGGTTSPAPTRTPRPSSTAAPFVDRLSSTQLIVAKLTTLGYSCNDGAPLESPGPGPDAVVRESAVCSAPDSLGPFFLAVIVGEGANGKVVAVTLKADLVGDTSEHRALLATAVAKVLAVSVLDELVGQDGGLWAKAHLPDLEASDRIDYQLDGVGFHGQRLANQSYVIVAQGVASS